MVCCALSLAPLESPPLICEGEEDHETAPSAVLKPRPSTAHPTSRRRMVRSSTPIYQTSTFEVADNDEQVQVTSHRPLLHAVGESDNTLAEQTHRRDGRHGSGTTFASGMGAITTTILALLRPATTLSRSATSMVASRSFFPSGCRSWGSKLRLWTRQTMSNTRERYGPNTRMLYLESPTNPSLCVVDFKKNSGAGEAAWPDQHDRQHLWHADQPASLRIWLRSGDAFGDEIPQRARRSDLRRCMRPAGTDGSALGDAHNAG